MPLPLDPVLAEDALPESVLHVVRIIDCSFRFCNWLFTILVHLVDVRIMIMTVIKIGCHRSSWIVAKIDADMDMDMIDGLIKKILELGLSNVTGVKTCANCRKQFVGKWTKYRCGVDWW